MYRQKVKRSAGLAPFILCVFSALCLPAHAQWGSIRANNRSAGEFRGREGARENRTPERGRENEGIRGGDRAVIAGRERAGEGEHHWGEEAGERRRFDIDEDRRRGYFWSGISPGMVFGTLPPGYVPLNVGNTPYYYYGGSYYEQAPSGYVAVNPPIGAVVAALPPGAEPLTVGPNVYYYAGGAFYLQGPQGFTVVPPPLGATVSVLPPGAAPVIINGTQYYQVDGAYFLPVMENGVIVYTIVQP